MKAERKGVRSMTGASTSEVVRRREGSADRKRRIGGDDILLSYVVVSRVE